MNVTYIWKNYIKYYTKYIILIINTLFSNGDSDDDDDDNVDTAREGSEFLLLLFSSLLSLFKVVSSIYL